MCLPSDNIGCEKHEGQPVSGTGNFGSITDIVSISPRNLPCIDGINCPELQDILSHPEDVESLIGADEQTRAFMTEFAKMEPFDGLPIFSRSMCGQFYVAFFPRTI